MKIIRSIFLLQFCFTLFACQPAKNQKPKGLDGLYTYTASMIDSLEAMTGDPFLTIIEKGEAEEIQTHFLACRNNYKKIEPALEYFMPGTAKGLNGAAIPEVEADEHKENEPIGLQVVETFLFPEYDTATKAALIAAVKNMHAMLYRAHQIWEVTTPTELQWIDAAYYEMIRVAAMGITGFDTPGCLTGIEESATALSSVSIIFNALDLQPNPNEIFSNAISPLVEAEDFDSFDRAAFLRGPWQKMFAFVAETREQKKGTSIRQPILASARNLFGDNFLNLSYFSHDTIGTNEKLSQLGETLFYDSRLSSNNKFSCATCHQPDKFFTDQKALSPNIHGTPLPRNTPSLVNAAFQSSFFWDMRVLNLDMQAKAVIDNSNEMHGSLDGVTQKLNKFPELVKEFHEVFNPTAVDFSIQPNQVTSALAAYQRTLVSFNAPFDRYMNGEDKAIETDAIVGFNLFMGKGKCATCHFPPTFAGLVPPFFDKMESEVIGTPRSAKNNEKDLDEGRYNIRPVEAWHHSFKTPTARNVAYTFPYMHNGIYQTLEEVVDFYNKGGGVGLGLDYPNQTLPPDPLNLTEKEQKQLVAFMNTLSSPIPVKNKAIAKKQFTEKPI